MNELDVLLEPLEEVLTGILQVIYDEHNPELGTRLLKVAWGRRDVRDYMRRLCPLGIAWADHLAAAGIPYAEDPTSRSNYRVWLKPGEES